jgi:hypothetical protein
MLLKTRDQKIVDFVRDFPDAVLTGSRYFGVARPNSDWDFMLPADDEYRLPLDFVRKKEPKYTEHDPLIAGVYESYQSNIHVQIVLDMPLKIRAQEIARLHVGALNCVPKEEQAYLWKAVVCALQYARPIEIQVPDNIG